MHHDETIITSPLDNFHYAIFACRLKIDVCLLVSEFVVVVDVPFEFMFVCLFVCVWFV